MRFAPTWLVVLGLVATMVACKGQPFRPDAKQDALQDAYDPPWWNPAPGEARNFDIQLTAPFDLTPARAMYVLELWDVVPTATMIDYGDGDPVAVPAGVLAGKIAELHARTPSTIVICHVNTGAIRLTDPDARKFPGFEASPPNRPTAPKAGSVIGWSTTEAEASERFLDIRAASRGRFSAIVFKRFDFAKTIGCDGIAADKNDAIAYETTINHGFGAIPIREHTSWSEEVAAQAHTRELSGGMRNGYTITAQSDELSDDFDWLWADRCAEYADCDQARPFLDDSRAVFAVDYDLDDTGQPNTKTTTCNRWRDANIVDGIIKTAALDKTRDACN